MWQKAEEFLSNDKHIGSLVEKWGHCTIKPIDESLYFEDLVDAIISQQLSGQAAKTIFNRLENLLGDSITAAKLVKLDVESLRKCGLSYAKCSYVKDLAAKTRNGELDINKLASLSDEEVVGQLTRVRGVGRWTAEMFLMFGLARPDIFPVDDLGIKKAFEKTTGKKWDKVESGNFAKTWWSPFRTIASWYLWRSLENR